MTDERYTDEEILKALKHCAGKDTLCGECPLFKGIDICCSVSKLALDLVNRQKSEIEELNIQLRELWNMASLYKAESEIWEGYNENLLTANTVLSNEILEAKALLKEMVGEEE